MFTVGSSMRLFAAKQLCTARRSVNSREKHGQFVASLQSHDFRGKVGGEDVNIESLSQGSGPFRVVILFDKSGSMESEAKRKVQQFIVGELVRSLPAGTQFALVTFGSRVSRQQGRQSYRGGASFLTSFL